MDFIKRTNAFLELGHRLKNMDSEIINEVIERASTQNPWFTNENISLSFTGLIHYLEEKRMSLWLNKYDFSKVSSKQVGVVMAGNIPMVGIHDMICVLISGHKLIAKLSSQDDVLIPFIANELINIEPEFKDAIQFVDKLKGMDAVIATGSDNTARYFDFYFSKYPNIIRKNRTSIAILTGGENPNELKDLGLDLFAYFGLGCRNVSKIFLPVGYDINKMISNLEKFSHLVNHNKYGNNYFYNRSIFLVNQTKHLDNGFTLFQQSEQLASPISVIYYDYYEDKNTLKSQINSLSNKIQCVVSEDNFFGDIVNFGKAQMPEIWDYADNIDTINFLTEI